MKVSALHIFPVKGLGGIEVQQRTVGPRGLTGDREFMLIDDASRFLTQRTRPELTQFSTGLTDTHLLVRHRAGELRLSLSEDPSLPLKTVTIWRDTFDALDCGSEAARFFTEILQQPVSLVRMSPRVKRGLDPTYVSDASAQTGFADAYPALGVCEGSLNAFNNALPEAVPMNRFRGNIVIAGSEPWAEDTWAQVQIGDAVFDSVKPCTRCVVITTDQATGQRNPEVLKALTAQHFWAQQGAVFGMNLVPTQSGSIKVGDEVRILKTTSQWILGARSSIEAQR